ncbi:MAG: vitamin B12 dependent-methionine synthase activation domain-containing protein [Prolixibacteraceae bacterium]|nr:vitamin B12 dependent-methionine synthase activation domain-containing protein [Prolixibacteraceae bacterium]
MIYNYQFNFQELDISRNEISELLGFKGEDMPEPFGSYLDEACRDAALLCDIRGAVYISENIEFVDNNSAFTIEGQFFDAGKLISRQLKKASSLALFICTAGEGISRKSQGLLHGDDPAKGYVYDVLGSITVETAMDKIQQQLRLKFAGSGEKITNRYSPGYCDWSVKDQHKLFSFFPENHCGILVNSSALMHPIKSVSGVIGIGREVKFNKYHCEMCTSGNCIYRNLRSRTEKIF